jgi:hypothetical protein
LKIKRQLGCRYYGYDLRHLSPTARSADDNMFLVYPLNFRQLSCSRLNYPVQFYSYQIVVLKLSIFLLTALKLYTKYAFIKRIEDLHPRKIHQSAGIRFAGHNGRGQVLNYDRNQQVWEMNGELLLMIDHTTLRNARPRRSNIGYK